MRRCQFPGCGKPLCSRGLCWGHYDQMKGGRELKPLRIRHGKAEIDLWIEQMLSGDGDESCIQWPFSRSSSGYGQLKRSAEDIEFFSAHRWICYLANGHPGDWSMQAAHSCGKGGEGCVNPAHLDWKTPVENNLDKLDHGTHQYGELVGNSKLTRGEVRTIFTDPRMARDIAADFGIDPSTVRLIKSRKVWVEATEDLASGQQELADAARMKKESDIRRMFMDPRSQQKIANEYGVSKSTVGLIKRRKVWASLTADLIGPHELTSSK